MTGNGKRGDFEGSDGGEKQGNRFTGGGGGCQPGGFFSRREAGGNLLYFEEIYLFNARVFWQGRWVNMKYMVFAVLFFAISVTAFLLNRDAEEAEPPQEIRRFNKEIPAIAPEPGKTREVSGAKRNDPATLRTEPLEASEWFAMIQKKRKGGLGKAEYLSAWSAFARENTVEALKAWTKFNYPHSRDLADVAEVIAEVLRERSAQDISNLLTPGFSEEQRGFLAGVVISEMPLPDSIRVWEAMSDKLGNNIGLSAEIARKLTEAHNKQDVLQKTLSSKNLSEAQVSVFVQNICQWAGVTDSALINTLLATLENDPSATEMPLISGPVLI